MQVAPVQLGHEPFSEEPVKCVRIDRLRYVINHTLGAGASYVRLRINRFLAHRHG
jgi:hypothetical protein